DSALHRLNSGERLRDEEFDAVVNKLSEVLEAAGELEDGDTTAAGLRATLAAAAHDPNDFLDFYEREWEALSTPYHLAAGLLYIKEWRLESALNCAERAREPILVEHLVATFLERPSSAKIMIGRLINLLERMGLQHSTGYSELCVFRGISTGSYRLYWDKVLFRWPAEYPDRFVKALAAILDSITSTDDLPDLLLGMLESQLREEELTAIVELVVPRLGRKGKDLNETQVSRLMRVLDRWAAGLPSFAPIAARVRTSLMDEDDRRRYQLQCFREGRELPVETVLDLVERSDRAGEEPEDLLRVLDLLPLQSDAAQRERIAALRGRLALVKVRGLFNQRRLDAALDSIVQLIGEDGGVESEILAMFQNPPAVPAAELHRRFLEIVPPLPDQAIRGLLIVALRNKGVDQDRRIRAAAGWLISQVREDAEIRCLLMRMLYEKGRFFEAFYCWSAVRQREGATLLELPEYAVVPMGVIRAYLAAGEYEKARRFTVANGLRRYLQTWSGQLLSAFIEYRLALSIPYQEERRARLQGVLDHVDLLAVLPAFREIALYISWNLKALITLEQSIAEVLRKIVAAREEEAVLEGQLGNILKPDPYYGSDPTGMKIQREVENLVRSRGGTIEAAADLVRTEFARERPGKKTREGLKLKLKKMEQVDQQIKEVVGARGELANSIGLPELDLSEVKAKLQRLRVEMMPHVQNEQVDSVFIYEFAMNELRAAAGVEGGGRGGRSGAREE
ncbi:hypothetical protein JW905_00315, partial [bacterium]|nr:hypothetical protein [candidate division CSSED10-310 bacterium]